MEKPVIIFGAKGIAKATLDIFNKNQIIIYGFLDDDEKIYDTVIDGIPVLGSTEDQTYLELVGKKCETFVAIDNTVLKKKHVEYLNKTKKVMPMNAIHPNSFIADSCKIGHGNFINTQSILSPHCSIGNHNIIHTAVVMEQESEIGNYVQIGARSIMGSNVKIADEVFIGLGVTVVSGISIGKGARIGAGSVVINNIKKNQTVFGNPAVNTDEK